jgi:group I intron endonuclease
MNFRIYKITNDINSKVYVGQTSKTLQERFDRHYTEGKWKNTKKMPIVFAIQKYGKEHFKIELLEELPLNYTQIQIDEKEKEWGLKLNCFSPNGYNLRLGNGRHSFSPESIEKIRKMNLGRKASEETKRRLSISHMGFIPTNATRKKLSNHFQGIRPCPLAIKNAMATIIKTHTLISPCGEKVTITNMAKYCRENGYNKGQMCQLVRGKKKSYRGWTRF